ncbi:MAG: signal peptidase I [Gammaproteobacteria bacterium AqS3]|nr:signal peptidase I [Gammaproteobacteria bacterium AqS3]
MKLAWLLWGAAAGLLALGVLWLGSLLGRWPWRRGYGNIAAVLVIVFVWQAIWHEFDFEWLLSLGLALALGCWAGARWLPDLPEAGRAELGGAAGYAPWLLGILLLRATLVEPFQIPSSSMLPTLARGDFLLVSKLSYEFRLPLLGGVVSWGEPARGDVVVFQPPNEERQFVKRVIGVPGDRVHLKDQKLSINGEWQDLDCDTEPGPAGALVCREQLPGGMTHPMQIYTLQGRPYGPAVIPAGHFLMMGDNRDNSSDSRAFGLVPRGNITGRAVYLWMHWPSWGEFPSFSRARSIPAGGDQ